MAPLLGEWLKPLSNFKHKKLPTRAHWSGDLQKLKCNHPAYLEMCSSLRKSEYMWPVLYYCVHHLLCKFFTFDEQSAKHLSAQHS